MDENVEGACAGGRENALHEAARQIIAEWRSIDLPALLVREGERQCSVHGRTLSVLRSELPDDHGGARYWGRDCVRPDVVLHAETEQIWCEVKVTHGVGDLKESRLKARNVQTLEFDLSEMHQDGGWSVTTLAHALRTDSSICHWVFHSSEESERQRLREKNRVAEAQRIIDANKLHADVRMLPPENFVMEAAGSGSAQDDDGLIPKAPSKRNDFIVLAYPKSKTYRLARAIAFLRRQPHGDGTCIVTFGSIGPSSRLSGYDAALSEFARYAGLTSVYDGAPHVRHLRGRDSYARLDQFFTCLEANESDRECDESSRI